MQNLVQRSGQKLSIVEETQRVGPLRHQNAPALCVILVRHAVMQGFAQHPIADGSDHAVFFCQRNKLHWHQQAKIGRLPTYQCLNTNNAATFQLDLWLKVQYKFFALDGTAQRRFTIRCTDMYDRRQQHQQICRLRSIERKAAAHHQ